jgi:hypothetical protein
MSKVKLYVSECYANGAGNLKRMKTRAKGRHGLSACCGCSRCMSLVAAAPSLGSA